MAKNKKSQMEVKAEDLVKDLGEMLDVLAPIMEKEKEKNKAGDSQQTYYYTFEEISAGKTDLEEEENTLEDSGVFEEDLSDEDFMKEVYKMADMKEEIVRLQEEVTCESLTERLNNDNLLRAHEYVEAFSFKDNGTLLVVAGPAARKFVVNLNK